VRVYADEDHILDVALLQQVPDLDARVTDRVPVVDFQHVDLLQPGGGRVAALRLELRFPLLLLDRVGVAAAVGLVDRLNALRLGGDLVARTADVGGQVGGFGGGLGALAGRVVLVGRHAAAGGVDDEHPHAAGLFEDLIHARGDLLHAADGVQAVVRVPHVADDD